MRGFRGVHDEVEPSRIGAPQVIRILCSDVQPAELIGRQAGGRKIASEWC